MQAFPIISAYEETAHDRRLLGDLGPRLGLSLVLDQLGRKSLYIHRKPKGFGV